MNRRIRVTCAWAIVAVLLAAGCGSGGGQGPARLDSEGGSITITNARVWTGDPMTPWRTGITVRDGKIAALDGDEPAGRVVDAGGRLVVPGFWDAHTHPQTPYTLTSPEAPDLFDARSDEEVLDMLAEYVDTHPEDPYPRMFGWMDGIFEKGEGPTRQAIDAVVSDRPVYLVHNSGHAHWANTKALKLAGVLERDPPGMHETALIERDPDTGLATGLLRETELASTDGILLSSVKKVKPRPSRNRFSGSSGSSMNTRPSA